MRSSGRRSRLRAPAAGLAVVCALPLAAQEPPLPAPKGEAAPGAAAPAEVPPAPVPSFPGALSGEIRARYYYVKNLFDHNSKRDDDLNFGTELVRLRAEGRPLDDLLLRFSVFEVRALGLGSRQVVEFPSVKDEQERPVEVDRALLEWKPEAADWTATLGRQPLVLGNGFLIGDGVRLVELSNLIGYLENNRQDFDALKVDWKPEGWAFSGFAGHVPDMEANRSLRKLYLAGLDVERDAGGGHRPGLSVVFARDARPRDDLLGAAVTLPILSPATPFTLDDHNARTLAVALRSKGPLVPPFGYSLEGVWETGESPSGANDATLAPERVRLRAWGLDARLLTFLHPERKDFVRLRYVHLTGDRPGRGNNQFDPLLENQVVGVLFNAQSNVHAWDVGATVASLEGWEFHADYWRFRFDQAYAGVLPFGLSRNGRLDAGQEVDFVVARQWNLHWRTELLAGIFLPGDAWREDNNNPIGFFTSDDAVWGARLTMTFSF